jgi:hypothetical protein
MINVPASNFESHGFETSKRPVNLTEILVILLSLYNVYHRRDVIVSCRDILVTILH